MTVFLWFTIYTYAAQLFFFMSFIMTLRLLNYPNEPIVVGRITFDSVDSVALTACIPYYGFVIGCIVLYYSVATPRSSVVE